MVLDRQDLFEHRRHKGERQVAVRDGPAEGAIGSTFGVDMNPLMVIRGVRERVDSLLPDTSPGRGPEVQVLSLGEFCHRQFDHEHPPVKVAQDSHRANTSGSWAVDRSIRTTILPIKGLTFRQVWAFEKHPQKDRPTTHSDENADFDKASRRRQEASQPCKRSFQGLQSRMVRP